MSRAEVTKTNFPDADSGPHAAGRLATLPLYGLTELRAAKSAFWRAVRIEFEAAGGHGAPEKLDFAQPIVPARIDLQLFFAQLCGYPLVKFFRDRVVVLAAPVYEDEHCDGATHCGVFVVHCDAPYQRLEDLRNTRFVFGGPHSNSGMNLPRRAIAEIAAGSAFFRSAVETDSQGSNIEAVVKGEADATCVDSVTYAFVARHRPEIAAVTRVLATTPRSPTIPFVTASLTEPATVELLRAALIEVGRARRWADARAGLLLVDIVHIEAFRYGCLLDYEEESMALGYPALS